MRPLSPHQLSRYRATVIARLDRLGALTVHDRGSNRAVRKLEFDLNVPGLGIPGIDDEAHFHYVEWFRRLRTGEWVRVRYDYNYRDLVHGGWRGYHLHPLPGSRGDPVLHQKCVLADGSGESRHYAAYEIDLLDAHDRLEALYASGEAIDCRGLRRID